MIVIDGGVPCLDTFFEARHHTPRVYKSQFAVVRRHLEDRSSNGLDRWKACSSGHEMVEKLSFSRHHLHAQPIRSFGLESLGQLPSL